MHAVSRSARRTQLRAAVERSWLERNHGAGWPTGRHLSIVEIRSGLDRDPPVLVVTQRPVRIPVRLRWQLIGERSRNQMWGSKVFGHVDEEDEHLHLFVCHLLGGDQKGVIEVVAVQRLLVVGGAGVLR